MAPQLAWIGLGNMGRVSIPIEPHSSPITLPYRPSPL